MNLAIDNTIVTPELSADIEHIRSFCWGKLPLDARLEPWMVRTLTDRDQMRQLIHQYGSPLNVLNDEPFLRNVKSLRAVAERRLLDFEVYFARKANKCIQFIDSCKSIDCGIDTASEVELTQVLERNFDQQKIICTAAVKPESLLRQCIEQGVAIAVDNMDELSATKRIAEAAGSVARICLRVSGFEHRGDKLFSRFGFDVQDLPSVLSETSIHAALQVAGVHFHLDGYDFSQRVSAVEQSIDVIDFLRQRGHAPRFLDIGGGIPMSYLVSEEQLLDFWREHEQSLLEKRPPLTYRNHGLGRVIKQGRACVERSLYPFWQSTIQAGWLTRILDAPHASGTIACSLRERNLQLRCEPGRSILDGCGMTIARVEFRKKNAQGDWLIGLSMNGTQCRTSSDDYLVDPILLPTGGESSIPDENVTAGFLVGAYCTESELLSLRRLKFPRGVRRGDLIAFPNTAGYFMHFLESRSHQFPLAKNVFVSDDVRESTKLDPIDA